MSDWPPRPVAEQHATESEANTSGDCLRVKPNKRQTTAGAATAAAVVLMATSKTEVLSSRHDKTTGQCADWTKYHALGRALTA